MTSTSRRRGGKTRAKRPQRHAALPLHRRRAGGCPLNCPSSAIPYTRRQSLKGSFLSSVLLRLRERSKQTGQRPKSPQSRAKRTPAGRQSPLMTLISTISSLPHPLQIWKKAASRRTKRPQSLHRAHRAHRKRRTGSPPLQRSQEMHPRATDPTTSL